MKKLFFLASLFVAAVASTTLTSCNSTEAKSTTEKPVNGETGMYPRIDDTNTGNSSITERQKWMLGTTEQNSVYNTVAEDFELVQVHESPTTTCKTVFMISNTNYELMSTSAFGTLTPLGAYIQKYPSNGVYHVVLSSTFNQTPKFLTELSTKIKSLTTTTTTTTTSASVKTSVTVETAKLATLYPEITRPFLTVNPGTLTEAQAAEFTTALLKTVESETDRAITTYKIKLWL